MNVHSPALVTARRLARASSANLLPVDGKAPAVPDCAILLSDSVPSDKLLAELATVLPRLQALVLWAPGWAEADAVLALGHHDFEHGSIDVLADPEPGVLAVLAADRQRADVNAEALRARERPLRTLAVMPVFNEADVIYHSVGALVAEGVDVYLIDHESTDGTAEAARPWLGRGLVHIERFPEDAGFPERNRHEMVWRDILRRVGEVTGEIDADWYMFVNADEFREAPWGRVPVAG
jgi:Glycosyl transferase family 2